MNSIAKTAVELSVTDMDLLLQGVNDSTTTVADSMATAGPANRMYMRVKLDALCSLAQMLIAAQRRIKDLQACGSMPADMRVDDDTGRPIVRPMYLVIEGTAYWLEGASGTHYLCTAPISAYSGAVLWDDDTEVDPDANPKHVAIVSALAALAKRDSMLDALTQITRSFIDNSVSSNPYCRPVVKAALVAIAEATGKSTFGSDWMDAIK